jgi:hypothetical protein
MHVSVAQARCSPRGRPGRVSLRCDTARGRKDPPPPPPRLTSIGLTWLPDEKFLPLAPATCTAMLTSHCSLPRCSGAHLSCPCATAGATLGTSSSSTVLCSPLLPFALPQSHQKACTSKPTSLHDPTCLSHRTSNPTSNRNG